MNIYEIVITEPAEADLRGIAQYIAMELKEPSVHSLNSLFQNDNGFQGTYFREL